MKRSKRMADTITLPRIQKPSTEQANWLTAHPWFSWPYYRCPRRRKHAYTDAALACCWAKALQDWIEATRSSSLKKLM